LTEFESTITIDRPVQEVFDLLADLENARYFDPECESVRRTTSGEIGVGTGFEFREPVPPFGRLGRTTCTYTAFDPPARVGLDFDLGGFQGSESYQFCAASTGTRLTTHGTIHLPSVLRPLSSVLAKQGRRIWDARLRRIKDWMEAGAPRDASWQHASSNLPTAGRKR
jgi:uncharacterized protein YndB with AHSA1/START domain